MRMDSLRASYVNLISFPFLDLVARVSKKHTCAQKVHSIYIAFTSSHSVLLLLLKWKHIGQGLGRWLGSLLHS